MTQIFRGCPVILPGLVARQDRFLFFFHEAIQGCRKFVADGASSKEIVAKSSSVATVGWLLSFFKRFHPYLSILLRMMIQVRWLDSWKNFFRWNEGAQPP